MLSVIILAAGFGTRMKSSTPKVLHRICGKSMIEYVIDASLRLSSDIHIILYNQREVVLQHVRGAYDSATLAKIHFHTQHYESFPGTGGALMDANKNFINVSGKKILVLSADTPLLDSKSLESLVRLGQDAKCNTQLRGGEDSNLTGGIKEVWSEKDSKNTESNIDFTHHKPCTPLFKVNDFDINISTFITQNPSGYGRVVREDSKNTPATAKGLVQGCKDSKNTQSYRLDATHLKENPVDHLDSKDSHTGVAYTALDGGIKGVGLGKSKVLKIIEEKDCDENQREIHEVNGGVYCFKKEILQCYIPRLKNDNAQGEFYLTDVIAMAIADSKSVGSQLFCEEMMQGVNTKLQLATAQDKMLDMLRQKAMLEGVSMDMPSSVYLDSSVEFRGECVLENGVRITGKSVIESSVIRAGSVIESSVITCSDVGPLAHIRPGSCIVDSHIGNFVECKAAVLTGVKAGHLSYLGDCEIDTGTNIGAGVITCNYDGRRKHKSIIGKNVFIGSDTQLIAPVRVEDNVLIAAGSTITKDIQTGDLAISRVNQSNLKGGFFKVFKH